MEREDQEEGEQQDNDNDNFVILLQCQRNNRGEEENTDKTSLCVHAAIKKEGKRSIGAPCRTIKHVVGQAASLECSSKSKRE